MAVAPHLLAALPLTVRVRLPGAAVPLTCQVSRFQAEAASELLESFPRPNATVGALMALAAFYSGCASLSDKWRETPLPAERILAARAAAAAFSRSASLGMRTPVAMPENFSLRRLAV